MQTKQGAGLLLSNPKLCAPVPLIKDVETRTRNTEERSISPLKETCRCDICELELSDKNDDLVACE